MSELTRTVQISEATYRRLSQQADAQQTSVDAIADVMLDRALPPALDDFPEQWRADLEQMNRMSDAMLWQMLEVQWPAKNKRLYDKLLTLKAERKLTQSEQERLAILQEEQDMLILRRSYALLLLQSRGHTIPNPYDVTLYG